MREVRRGSKENYFSASSRKLPCITLGNLGRYSRGVLQNDALKDAGAIYKRWPSVLRLPLPGEDSTRALAVRHWIPFPTQQKKSQKNQLGLN
jgi:hypothetical protein